MFQEVLTPPLIATVLFAFGIVGLFIFDREWKLRTSKALWIPVVWMLLVSSRPLSEWLQDASSRTQADNLEGNPLERSIFALLLVLGLMVLALRGRKVFAILRVNWPIILFFLYCAASTLWSDYPDVAFKRWIKALGDLAMVMIILTDPEPLAALKRFLARTGFLLVPTSVLLIKYFPRLGEAYKVQDGRQVFVGVTNNKNLLGVICLLFGLGAAWRILHLLREKQNPRGNRPRIAQAVILAMVFWLFLKANSMTSLACFLLAGGLIVATSFPAFARKRAVVHLLVLAMLVTASLALFSNIGAGFVKNLGRDPTLTGRTELWSEVISMNGNPLLGTGFESFWMGNRLEKIWRRHWWHPNEAHNGYLEVYLNLGWIGLALLALVIVTGYRNALAMLRQNQEAGSLRLAYIVLGIIYSFTEAGFRLLSPIWISFMLAAIAMPKKVALESSGAKDSLPEPVALDIPSPVPQLLRSGGTARYKLPSGAIGH